jgi:hypothetical protein
VYNFTLSRFCIGIKYVVIDIKFPFKKSAVNLRSKLFKMRVNHEMIFVKALTALQKANNSQSLVRVNTVNTHKIGRWFSCGLTKELLSHK